MQIPKINLIAAALAYLCNGAKFEVHGDDYESIKWMDERQIPTEKELKAEIERIENELKNSEYKRNRSKEYPPITDYLDGIVKGDAAQVEKYIADCLAVKAKYPKPVAV